MSVRKTVDLNPQLNAKIGAWQLAAAVEVGRTRVTFQDLTVALIEQLLADDDLTQRIKDKLADNA